LKQGMQLNAKQLSNDELMQFGEMSSCENVPRRPNHLQKGRSHELIQRRMSGSQLQ